MRKKNFLDDSWEKLLEKKYPVMVNEHLEKDYMRIFPNFSRVIRKDSDFFYELIKPVGYFVDLIYYLIHSGNMEKTKYFHRNKNRIFKKMNDMKRIMDNKKYKKYVEGDKLNLNGIYMPILDKDNLGESVPDEVFKIFLNFKEDYTNFEKVNAKMGEDPYLYKDSDADITIKKGMNVIDCGAWIGDFSAYASKKGAKVYAFEPSPETFKWLKKTAKMNKNIFPINVGIAEKEGNLFFENKSNCGGNKIVEKNGIKIKVISLDDWTKKNKIKVDFIKADIEGFERNLLVGAKRILKEDQPLLSLCTYHMPDDPEIMGKIILKANPNYKIIQKYRKMFAYVSKELR